MTVERRHVGKRLSELVIHRPFGPCRSQASSPKMRKPTFRARRDSVLAQIDRLLGEAGSDKTKIVSATIYLPSMGDFAAMNAVWEAWVPAGQTPARATVEAKLANPDYKRRDPGRRGAVAAANTRLSRNAHDATPPRAAARAVIEGDRASRARAP